MIARRFKSFCILIPLLALLLQACTSGSPVSSPQASGNLEETSEVVAEPAVTDQARFATGDGEEISGLVYGQGDIGIVLAHMRGRGQSSWAEFATQASDSGYVVLTFDFRGYGDSTGTKDKRMDRVLYVLC